MYTMVTYKEAGVDKKAGYEHVRRLKQMVKQTHNPQVLGSLGSFAALYQLTDYKQPVLVSGTDGVGTKLKVAFELERYDTVGIDLVAMCVNDILCHGAKPLFFLDYLACSQLEPERSTQLVSGIVQGCKQAQCALVGGETAEMPGFYQPGEYDMAGFAVGVVEKDQIIDGSTIQAADQILALPSSGIHSNGYSLVRKIFTASAGQPRFPAELLTPTKIYVEEVLNLLERGVQPSGLVNITGGGLIENIPRVLPDGLGAVIETARVKVPKVFSLEPFSAVPPQEMWGTFNMGVGFVIICPPAQVKQVRELIPEAYRIGQVEVSQTPIVLR